LRHSEIRLEGSFDLTENKDDNIAIYLDFENLVISSEEVYISKEKPLSLEPIVDFAASRGNISIKRAYANWQPYHFSQYERALLNNGFELVHLPITSAQGKNGVDVRLAVDVMENLELFPSIDTIVIGSGDTDFIPLLQKIRARGKNVIVVGFEHSVGSLVKSNCTEFKSLTELLGEPEPETETESEIAGPQELSDEGEEEEENGEEEEEEEEEEEGEEEELRGKGGKRIDAAGRDVMIRYIKNRSDEEPVLMSNLKVGLKRIDPSFSEKKFGFSSFKKYVESLEGDLVEKITHNEKGVYEVHLVDAGDIISSSVDATQKVKKYLNTLKYQRANSRRSALCRSIYKYYRGDTEHSMQSVTDHLYSKMGSSRKISRKAIQKFVITLFEGGALVYSRKAEKGTLGALKDRPLKLADSVKDPNMIEKAYIKRIREILNSEFPDLDENIINQTVTR